MGRLSRITAAAVGLALGAGLPACGGAGHSRRAATAPSTSSSVAQSSASVSSSPQPPPNPGRVARPGAGVLRGRIVLASGQASGAVGAVSVRLRSGVQGGPATVTIISAPCPGATHCRRLQGTLRGTLTAVHSLPDVGRRFALSAHGTLTSLGAVSATGIVATPGNIRAGMETLTIEVAGRGARFSLVARSGLVPGFSGP